MGEPERDVEGMEHKLEDLEQEIQDARAKAEPVLPKDGEPTFVEAGPGDDGAGENAAP